jgi:hypothetical protein
VVLDGDAFVPGEGVDLSSHATDVLVTGVDRLSDAMQRDLVDTADATLSWNLQARFIAAATLESPRNLTRGIHPSLAATLDHHVWLPELTGSREILPLVRRMLRAGTRKGPAPSLDPRLARHLRDRAYPGSVPELAYLVERLLAAPRPKGAPLDLSHLPAGEPVTPVTVRLGHIDGGLPPETIAYPFGRSPVVELRTDASAKVAVIYADRDTIKLDRALKKKPAGQHILFVIPAARMTRARRDELRRAGGTVILYDRSQPERVAESIVSRAIALDR